MEKQIIENINEEAQRIQHGTLYVSINVTKGELTSMQVETKKSIRLKF